jgi:hypothetical protein
MRVLILLAALSTFPILASEDWLCVTESSQVRGNVVLSCGVGEAATESEARAAAFDSAEVEFSHFHATASAIEPKRTTCAREDGGWKCYRAVEYTLGAGPVIRAKLRITTSAIDRLIAKTANDMLRGGK